MKSYEAYIRRGYEPTRISEVGCIDQDTYIDWDKIVLQAYRVSLKKATSDPDALRRDSAERAIDDEFDNLMGMN